MSLLAFEVWPCWRDTDQGHRTIVHERTAGRAKMQFIRMLDSEIRFIDVRVRKLGAPRTDEHFTRNAIYRGMPDLRIGQRVKVGKSLGAIVGHNASANFDVLFDDDAPEYAGMRLNVHPQDCQLVRAETAVTA